MEAKEQIQSLKNLVIRQDNKIYSLQEELSISNTQREGYKKERDEQREVVLNLQGKLNAYRTDIIFLHSKNETIERQESEIKDLQEKNREQANAIKDLSHLYNTTREGSLELARKWDLKIKEQGEEIVNLREGIKFFLEGFIEFVETEPEVYQRKKAQMDAVKKGFESIKDQWINDNI